MKKVFTKQKMLSLIYKLLIAGVVILVDLLTKSFFQNYFSNPDIPAIPVIDHVISFV